MPVISSAFDAEKSEPPPEFKGSRLELKLVSKISDAELVELLGQTRELTPREWSALFERVGRSCRMVFVEPLLACRPEIPDSPGCLGHYAVTVASLLRNVDFPKDPRGEEDKRRLREVILEVEARRANNHRAHLGRSDWRSMRQTLDSVLGNSSGRPKAASDEFAMIRDAIHRALRLGIEERAGYRGGLELLHVAVRIGNVETWNIFLELLDRRETFYKKLSQVPIRKDVVFLQIVIAALAREASEAQLEDLAALLIRAIGEETDPKRKLTLCQTAQSVTRQSQTPQPARAALKRAIRAAY